MKQILKPLGTALSIAALFYLFWSNRHFIDDLSKLNWHRVSVYSGLSLLLYFMGNFFLVKAWKQTLNFLNSTVAMNYWRAFQIYGKSQIAKYLPGNIFHYAFRHGLGSSQGYSHRELILSALIEPSLLVCSVCLIVLFSGLHLDFLRGYLTYVDVDWSFRIGVLLILMASVFYLVKKVVGIRKIIKSPKPLLSVLACYLVFFFIAGTAFYLLSFGLPVENPPGYGFMISSFSVSWLIGFLIPGASAGIGVRDLIIAQVLSPVIGPAASFSMAVLIRLVTTGSDVLFWASTHRFFPSKKSCQTT